MLPLNLRVEEYERSNGSIPYRIWFNSLDAQAAAKVSVAVHRIRRGLVSSIKWFDSIGEYRIDWGPGLRIYLMKDQQDLIILLGGGNKKSQNQDIENAKKLCREYKERKWA